MLPEKKGIYPSWVSDNDVINQILKEIIAEGGKLPMLYVINPSHDIRTQERIKRILERMQKEKLILHLPGNDEFLEIDIEGSRAAYLGYKRYQRIKIWNTLRHRLNRLSLVFFAIVVLALIGFVIYLVLRYFKVM